MQTITSRQNEKIKAAAALLNAAERKKTGLYLLEGARLCEAAALQKLPVESLFVTEEALQKYASRLTVLTEWARQSYLIPSFVAERLSDTKSGQEIFCVCRALPPRPLSQINANGFYVFTENIQNPDNLGAIARSAEALGADGLIVAGGCDITSPKALRASMGALLRFPVFSVLDALTAAKELKAMGLKLFVTVLDDEAQNIRQANKSGGCAVIIGNEGNGVSRELIEESTHKITIPMKGCSESLNACAAAAITVWEFTRAREN